MVPSLFLTHVQVCVRETVFEVLIYFTGHEDEEVQLKALTAIGKRFDIKD